MKKPIDTAPKQETAVLVGLIYQRQDKDTAEEYINELEFLASTLGLKTVNKYTQALDHPDVRTFVGKGKLEEIEAFVKANKVDTVIFDDELSPSQVRNLEKVLEVKIYDRSLLILDIFLLRAKTAQAKIQVELARYQYLLPRLTRMWTHLERQRGGTGTRGGAGEKEIETDRRDIRRKIDLLKERLEKVEKQGETQRKSRQQMVRVALVGYTNVGKSTLMRILSKEDVFAEDKLFATVDSTVRKVSVGTTPFLLTDTVGFIRKLPHSLVECFKSTLAEIKEADILLHVIDISHPAFEDQMDTVNRTLTEIGANDKEMLLVFNKVDAYREPVHSDEMEVEESRPSLVTLKDTYLNRAETDAVFISASERENLEELREVLNKKVESRSKEMYPYY